MKKINRKTWLLMGCSTVSTLIFGFTEPVFAASYDFTTLTVPGASYASGTPGAGANGINNLGQIVGYYGPTANPSTPNGFLYSGGGIHLLPVAGRIANIHGWNQRRWSDGGTRE